MIVLKLAEAFAKILRQESEGKCVRIGHLLRFLEVFSPLRCREIGRLLALELLEVLAHRCQGKRRPELGEHFFRRMHVDHLVALVSSVDEQLGSDEAVELFLGEQRRTIDDDSVGRSGFFGLFRPTFGHWICKDADVGADLKANLLIRMQEQGQQVLQRF